MCLALLNNGQCRNYNDQSLCNESSPPQPGRCQTIPLRCSSSAKNIRRRCLYNPHKSSFGPISTSYLIKLPVFDHDQSHQLSQFQLFSTHLEIKFRILQNSRNSDFPHQFNLVHQTLRQGLNPAQLKTPIPNDCSKKTNREMLIQANRELSPTSTSTCNVVKLLH